MKAITFQDVEHLAYEDAADPKIVLATDVIVRVTHAGICGSDLHPYFGREVGLDVGTVMGHELVGEIVEVGNLAAFGNASPRLLIVALTDLLIAQGFRWVVFTGTPTLLNSFQRLTLSPIDLGPADPLRLGEARLQWGSYYATQPRVMAGYIPEGFNQLQRRGLFERMRYQPDYLQTGSEIANDCA